MEVLEKLVEMFMMESSRYFIIAGLFFLIFYKLFSVKFKQAKIQNSKASKKDFFREIFYSVQSSIIFVLVAATVVLTPAIKYTNLYTDINAYPIWYIPISVILALIIHDTYFYWMHKTIHKKRFYQTIHKTHHLSINPSPWAAFSFHFLEAILEGSIFFVLAFSIPMHPLALLGFGVSSFTINAYGHLGYEIMPKWFRNSFLFQIFNSSVHHNMHHQTFNYNFGLYFRIWDKIMDTEHPKYEEEFDRLMAIRLGEIE